MQPQQEYAKQPAESPYTKLNEPEQGNPYNQGYAENMQPPPQPYEGQDAQMAYNYDSQAFASDANKLHSKKSSCHCQAFVATMFLVGGITAGVVLYLNKTIEIGPMFGIIGGGYLLYLLIGCCCNPLREYLSNISGGQHFQNYYEWVRNGIGHFSFHAQCYHYQTRHHTRTVRDANGNSRTQHYTTTQKVVTHTATQNLTPIRTVDQSGPVDRIRADTNIVFIHFLIRYKFSDFNSQNNFNMFFSGFKMRHTRDVHQDFSYKYVLPGLIERKAFVAGQMGCNYPVWFYVCGIVGMLWPFSLCTEKKISRFDVISMKSVSL